MDIVEYSMDITAGGLSQALAISSTSAQSAAINGGRALIYATTACFARQGSNPTALSNGTDQYIPAGIIFRIYVPDDAKIAFITTSASGTVYITPGA